MLLEAQSIAAKNTNKAKKLEDEIAEAHSALRMLHAMKSVRGNTHRGKVKNEKETYDRLLAEN